MKVMTNKERFALLYFAMSVPVIAFAIYIYRHALNVPYMDDMELIDSVNIFKKGSSNFFVTLFRQQNDHRSTFSRLGVILIYLIRGSLDFRLMIFLGYFNLILLGYAFFLIYKSQNKQITLFLPVTLLLFSPVVYCVHLWSITAFQYTLSIAFSLLSLYFLQPEKKSRWFFAFPLAVAASLTNLDGLSVIPLSIFWLLTQKRWKESAVFSVLTVVYLTIYFTDFRLSSASNIDFSFANLPVMGHAFVVITGSIAKFVSDTHGVVLSTIVGLGILGTFVVFKFFPRVQGKPASSPGGRFSLDLTDMCFLRMLASMVMIMIGRHAQGIGTMIAPRFQIYAVSMAIIFYLFLVKSAPFRNAAFFKFASIGLALVVSVYSYKKYERQVNFYDAGLKADSYNYTTHRTFLHQYFNLPEPAHTFYENYSFPEYFNKAIIKAWKSAAVPATGLGIEVTDYPKMERYANYLYGVKGIKVLNVGQEVPGKDVYLGLSENATPNRFYLVALKDGRPSWGSGDSAAGEFNAEIPEKIKSGLYTATLCWLEAKQPHFKLISKKVSL
jgi:hypothetical protein